MSTYNHFNRFVRLLAPEYVTPVSPTANTTNTTKTVMHASWDPGIFWWLLDLWCISVHVLTSADMLQCNHLFPESRCQQTDDNGYNGDDKENYDVATKDVRAGGNQPDRNRWTTGEKMANIADDGITCNHTRYYTYKTIPGMSGECNITDF